MKNFKLTIQFAESKISPQEIVKLALQDIDNDIALEMGSKETKDDIHIFVIESLQRQFIYLLTATSTDKSIELVESVSYQELKEHGDYLLKILRENFWELTIHRAISRMHWKMLEKSAQKENFEDEMKILDDLENMNYEIFVKEINL